MLVSISVFFAFDPEATGRLRRYLVLCRVVPTLVSVALITSVLGSCGCSALAPWKKTSTFNTQQAKRWTNGGLSAIQKGRYDQAQRCFTKAMDHNPNDPQIQTHLAEALAQKGDITSAIAHLENATQRAPVVNPINNVRLGELYLANGQWIPARRQVEIALGADRHLASAWVLKGKTEYAKGSWKAALADFQRALGYQPKSPEVHLQIADTYEKLNQPMRALATVEKLLSHYPTDKQPERAVIAKSVALMNLKHYQSAIGILQLATQKADATSDVYVSLSRAQLLAGQTSQARMTLNQAKRRFPNQHELNVLVADLQADNRDVALLTNK